METTTFDLGSLLSFIKYPLITEKAINLQSKRQYTFIVDRSLTKPQIQFALEKIFKVTILRVNTCILPSKFKRVGKFLGKKTRYKKAYVTLKEGDDLSDLVI